MLPKILENNSKLFNPQLEKWNLELCSSAHFYGISKKKLGDRNFGEPILLIEGTHGISFANRLFELNMIDINFQHQILLISEN